RALHANLALDAGRALAGALVERRQDADGHAATRLADGEKTSARVGPQRHAARPDGDGQGGLGEAVARRDDALEAEVRLEGLDRRHPHGLGAGERRLETREIESGRVADVAHTVA